MLGVGRTVDEKTLRSAYRKLAREHHPDLNPGDKAAEERFKDINEAFEVLSDPDKRKLYDRFGDDWQRYREAGFTGDEPAGSPESRGQNADFGTWFSGQSGASAGSGSRTGSTSREDLNGEEFSDFFETMFGSRGRSTAGRPRQSARLTPVRGQDLEVAVEASFDEAFQGSTRQLQLQSPKVCPTCQGTGYIRDTICPTCSGAGIVNRSRTLEVTLPAGVATGSRVRITGQGSPGENGGPTGDVYLLVTVRPDPRFEREGDDLRVEVDVPVTTAALGGETVVQTPSSRVALNIPPETQSGKVFRLRGQGMPKLKGPKGQRGDLLAKARLVIPSQLTEQEKQLFQELRRLREEKTS